MNVIVQTAADYLTEVLFRNPKNGTKVEILMYLWGGPTSKVQIEPMYARIV